jgi:predicted histidine transporter YuiF (NhaC family)
MAQPNRARSSRSFQSVDAVIDTIRDNIHRVEDLTAVLDRQTQRTVFVSYLLLLLAGILSLATFVVTSIFPNENVHTVINERVLVLVIIAFLVFFALGFGFILVTALGRRRLFVQQLQFATMRLAEIVKVASQTQEHLELDRLESMTLQFHLREAEGALAFADRVLPRSARNTQFSAVF